MLYECCRIISTENKVSATVRMLEEGLLCSQMTLKYFLLKIILESSLNLPRGITPAKEIGRSAQLDGAVTH